MTDVLGPPPALEAGRASPPLSVIGVHGGQAYGPSAEFVLRSAEVLVASPRHLAQHHVLGHQAVVELAGPLDRVLERIAAERHRQRRVALLASGDPGFFGIVRVLAQRFGSDALDVHPAPSSVSLAFARIGCAWDDALVVSAHGRPLAAAVAAVLRRPKVAVLTSPAQPPEQLGRALIEAGSPPRDVTVASRLGEPDESVARTDLQGLADASFDAMSVVVLLDTSRASAGPGLVWGLPESAFEHRAGMVTKAEVRAVVLSKLRLPASGVVWDVGAGSGSVGIECARLAPGIDVFAIERNAEDADRIRHNAAAHGVTVTVVHAEAPTALHALPVPDRVFVGGGGMDVVEQALRRLRPGGQLVATHILVDRAAAAWKLLGNTVQVSVARGAAIADGFRLQAENPVFISWGPLP